MEKVIRDGKVAVLYSPGYGAGWYTWNGVKELIFDPKVVELVEENKRDQIPEYIKSKYGDKCIYSLGAEDLKIEWMDEGQAFEIDEYDGYESIRYREHNDYIFA